MTIKVTADTNATAAIGTTGGLPIDPEGDQEADPSPDIEKVTPGADDAQEVLLIHVLLEGINQTEGPDHDPDPDLGPGSGIAEEGQGLVPTIVDQGWSLGSDSGPGEDAVAVPEAVMVPDLQTRSAQDGTPSPHKANIELAAHSVDLITPVVFQFMLPNYLIIPNQYHIPLVQYYCQGLSVISLFLPQCLHLGHILSNFEIFS